MKLSSILYPFNEKTGDYIYSAIAAIAAIIATYLLFSANFFFKPQPKSIESAALEPFYQQLKKYGVSKITRYRLSDVIAVELEDGSDLRLATRVGTDNTYSISTANGSINYSGDSRLPTETKYTFVSKINKDVEIVIAFVEQVEAAKATWHADAKPQRHGSK